MTTRRLEAFSDGVFAIIITITILVIDLPNGNDMKALIGILPLVACYLISFVMVGANWANHHHLMQVARSVDERILWANLLYLFLLSFQPVCTGWVGKSYFAMLPVRVYVIVNLAGALSYLLLERAIIHSSDCKILRTAVEESIKEHWTVAVEVAALILSFIPGLHYAACPLLVVAMLPWMIPDQRMKRVFEELTRSASKTKDDMT